MKKIITPFCWLISAGVLFTACNAGQLNTKAEKSANDFYADLQKKDYEAALNLCSNEAFKEDTKDTWKSSLEKNAGLLGNLQSFTKTSGFNIATSTTSGTTVSVAYDVQWQYGKSVDSIFLIKENDGSMKILRYTWQQKDTKYMAAMTESEKQASQYISAIKSGNYDAAIALCSQEALAITPKNQWAAFLQHANQQLGTLTDYTIVMDSSAYHIAANGNAGQGNYYDVLIESARGNNKIKEKIICFQKDYNDPVKVTGHLFL